MRKLLGIAAALALASGAPAVTTGAAQDPQDDVLEREIHAIAIDEQGADDVLPRHLAVLGGRGVELGVTIRDLDEERAGTTHGAVVEGVRSDSPAARAGFAKGDVITEFDGERVRSARQLSRLVSETPQGRTVQATVLRDGKALTLSVTPEAGRLAQSFEFEGPAFEFEHLPRVPEFRWHEREGLENAPPTWEVPGGRFLFRAGGRSRLGVVVQNLTPQLAEYFGTENGALIASVEPDSAAAKAGLKAGDVVTAVNGRAVSDPSELSERVREADEGALTIEYTRDRQRATTEATLESPKPGPAERHTVRPI